MHKDHRASNKGSIQEVRAGPKEALFRVHGLAAAPESAADGHYVARMDFAWRDLALVANELMIRWL